MGEAGVLPEPLPEAQIEISANQEEGIEYKQTQADEVQLAENVVSEREMTLRRDTKTESQMLYMGALNLVTKTWGPISEALDVLDVLKDSFIVNGKRRYNLTVDEIRQALLDDDVDIELDIDAFVGGVLRETLEDLLIGKLSKGETALLKEMLPLNHPLRS